jgi:sensor c-di-GMP phosphodiesterase-like protein
MTKSFSTTMTLLVALLVVAIPVTLAIYLADRQAHKTELSLVTGYARDVLHRSETTSDQILSATNSPGRSPYH